jgi:hypothetical protein
MPSKNRQKPYFLPTLAVISSLFLLTSCGASGPDAPTRMIKQVTDGVEGQSNSLVVRNLLIVAQGDGSGVLVGTIINEGTAADTLVSISAAGITAPIAGTPIALTQNNPVIFAGPSGNASATFSGLTQTAGQRLPVVVTFGNAAPIKLDALVVAKDGDYANVGPVTLVKAAPAKK